MRALGPLALLLLPLLSGAALAGPLGPLVWSGFSENDTDRAIGTATVRREPSAGCEPDGLGHLAFRPYPSRGFQLVVGEGDSFSVECGPSTGSRSSYYYPATDIATIGYSETKVYSCSTVFFEVGPFRGVDVVEAQMVSQGTCAHNTGQRTTFTYSLRTDLGGL